MGAKGKEPRKVGAAQFKAHCLSILDELEPDGIIVTKHGRAVARVLPMPRSSAELIGSMKGTLEVRGDLMTTGLRWEADD